MMETKAIRHKLEHTREGITHKVEIEGADLYITANWDKDGNVKEIFLNMGKAGSTMRGLLDQLGLQSSLLLQYGMPLGDLCDKMMNVSYDPQGRTNNKDIPQAKSVADYTFKWLKRNFVDEKGKKELKARLEEGHP